MFENQQKEVEVLIKSDSEFRSLYQRHQELDSKVRDAELGVLPLDDTTLHNMKKEKLRAKDRLTHMWERYRSTHRIRKSWGFFEHRSVARSDAPARQPSPGLMYHLTGFLTSFRDLRGSFSRG
jgi:uncharacterized protein YdcH (DUF465 family)